MFVRKKIIFQDIILDLEKHVFCLLQTQSILMNHKVFDKVYVCKLNECKRKFFLSEINVYTMLVGNSQ
jgi:hypothetical protein